MHSCRLSPLTDLLGLTLVVVLVDSGALTQSVFFAYYEGILFLGLNKKMQEETSILADQYHAELCKTSNQLTCSEEEVLN